MSMEEGMEKKRNSEDTITHREVFMEVMRENWNKGGFDRAMVFLIFSLPVLLAGVISYEVIVWLLS